jgi:molybdate transport system substrate-binding protein
MALGAIGCHNAASTNDQPLRIAAASDLQLVLPGLAERFQAKTRTATTLTFDASGRLAEQIKAGAPYDVFLSANQSFPRELARAGLLLPDSVRPYARGALVLCLHRSAGDQVHELKDLSRPEIKKIAIANPEYAPYGMAARQALQRADLWSILEAKIVRTDSVRQALIHAQNGDAEAALVSRAQANVPEVRMLEIDPTLYDPLIQALGIISGSRSRDRAEEFVQFMLGPEGQSMLREGGFEKPASTTAPAADESTPAKPSPPRE